MDKWINEFDVNDFLKYQLVEVMKTCMRFNHQEIFYTLNESINSLKDNCIEIPEILRSVIFTYCVDDVLGTTLYNNVISEMEYLSKYRKITTILENVLDEFCEENYLCRQCGEELEVVYYEDSREFCGAPCVEVFSESMCPNGCYQ